MFIDYFESSEYHRHLSIVLQPNDVFMCIFLHPSRTVFFFFFRSYLLKSFVKAVEDIFACSMIVPRLGGL